MKRKKKQDRNVIHAAYIPERKGPQQQLPYWGESACGRSHCSNAAYYAVGLIPYCGVHSQPARKAGTRITLVKNPNAASMAADELKKHQDGVTQAAAANKARGAKGTVETQKLTMFRVPQLIPNVLNVFPNFNHSKRKDGWGCVRLSPKSLGPVYHGQPGLPPAKNLENFQHANKVYFYHHDDGVIHPLFFEMQVAMYQSDTPYGHQFEFLKAHPQFLPDGCALPTGLKKPDALFSVWITRTNEIKRCGEIDSRVFYCTALEILLQKESQWAKLTDMVANGTNVSISGYSAQPLHRSSAGRYLDARRPFGHEDVIATMLRDPPATWPWRIHATAVEVPSFLCPSD